MKYIYTIILLLFFPLFANAEILPKTVYAVTPIHLSYDKLKANQIIELYELNEKDCNQEQACIEKEPIKVKIIEYKKAKRGKLNGHYKIEYHNDSIIMQGTMRASTPKDFESMAKQAGIAITGHILKVPGFSQVMAVSKGLLKPNENQNRMQSAGTNLYKSTPLTYSEKGKEFEVEEDGIIVLKLKSEDDSE